MFSDFIQQELKRRDWSQADLARESGLSKQAISYLLVGRSKAPDVETIKKIADAFEIPYEIVYRKAGLLPKEKENVDEWALAVAAKINRLPAESRNLVDILIKHLYDLEHGGKDEK